MRLALLLNVIDSRIGGVLIMGDRGTGKSVAVRRNLHELLTQQGAENGAGAGGRCATAQHLPVFSHRSRVPERRCAGAYRSRRRHKRCCATCDSCRVSPFADRHLTVLLTRRCGRWWRCCRR